MYKNRSFLAERHDPPLVSLPLSQEMRQHLMAWLPQGILGPKMAGFVSEQGARVLEAGPDHVRLLIGRKRWIPWGNYGDDFPMEVTIKLNRETACVRSLTHVIAEVKPLASNVSDDVLRKRIRDVVRALRDCLLAQELELT
jgi:hypothetical protein